MPFKSKRQQRWMFANKPRMAKRWAEHTPNIKALPERAKAKKKSRSKTGSAGPSSSQGLLSAAERLFGSHGVALPESTRARLLGAQAGHLVASKEAQMAGEYSIAGQPEQKKPSSGGCVGPRAVEGYYAKIAGLAGKPVPLTTNTPLGRIPEGSAASDQSFLQSFDKSKSPIPQHFTMIGSVHDPRQGAADIFGSPIAGGKLGNGPGVGMSGAGTQMNFMGGGVPKVAGVKTAVADADMTLNKAVPTPPTADNIQEPTSLQTGAGSPNALIEDNGDIRFRRFGEHRKPEPLRLTGGGNTAQARGDKDMKSKFAALLKASKDLIPGGKADDKPTSKYSKKELAMGKKVEMEHVDDKPRATEISKDHLEEIPDYYTRLKKMEESAGVKHGSYPGMQADQKWAPIVGAGAGTGLGLILGEPGLRNKLLSALQGGAIGGGAGLGLGATNMGQHLQGNLAEAAVPGIAGLNIAGLLQLLKSRSKPEEKAAACTKMRKAMKKHMAKKKKRAKYAMDKQAVVEALRQAANTVMLPIQAKADMALMNIGSKIGDKLIPSGKKKRKKTRKNEDVPESKEAALLKAAKSIATGTAARKKVPKSEFAYTGKAPEGESKREAKGKYPMPDAQHAASAKGFAAMHHGKGSAEYKRVAAKANSLGYGKSAADVPKKKKRIRPNPAHLKKLVDEYSNEPQKQAAALLKAAEGLTAPQPPSMGNIAGQAALGGLAGAALPGAVIGGGLGALHGLVDPGYDREGKKRSRLLTALKRGLGYGIGGAGLTTATSLGNIGGMVGAGMGAANAVSPYAKQLASNQSQLMEAIKQLTNGEL